MDSLSLLWRKIINEESLDEDAQNSASTMINFLNGELDYEVLILIQTDTYKTDGHSTCTCHEYLDSVEGTFVYVSRDPGVDEEKIVKLLFNNFLSG
jgi:hypothetical protein